MLQRIAILAGSLAAALTLAAAAAIGGLAPRPSAPVESTVTQAAAPVPPTVAPQVDTVYLTTPAQTTVTVRRTVHVSGGESGDGESEGAGGDD